MNLQISLLPIRRFPQQEVPLQPLLTLDPDRGVGIPADEVIEPTAGRHDDGSVVAGLGVHAVFFYRRRDPGLDGDGDDVVDGSLVAVDDGKRGQGVGLSDEDVT